MATGKQYSYCGVLHTKSSFAPDYTLAPRTDYGLQATIARLEIKEKQAYNSVFPGCSTFADFISRIRNFFGPQYEYDARAFRSFTNYSLNEAIRLYKNERLRIQQQYKEYKFQINIDDSRIKDSFKKAILQGLSGGKNWSVSTKDNTFEFRIGIDKSAIGKKDLFNKMFGKHYKTSSDNETMIKQFFNEYANQLITFAPDSPKTLFFEAQMPWDYKVEDLRNASKNPQLYQEIQKALSSIKAFVKKNMGFAQTSVEMQKAFEMTWKNNISPWISNSKIEEIGAALFMKGGTTTSLTGGFGEFAAALLGNYIQLRMKQNGYVTNKLKSKISNSIQKGEQSKRDVTILNDIGIQVKNYNPYSSLLLTTTQHPDQLTQITTFPDVIGFQDFLANYFFNKSSQSKYDKDLIEWNLQGYFAEIANLDLNTMFSDGVSFYFIEGSLLIPASHIAKAVQTQTMNLDVEITSSYRGKTDDEYASPANNPLYRDYWTRQEGHGWHYTEKNITEYNNILSQISIRTKFDYRQLNLQGYRLF